MEKKLLNTGCDRSSRTIRPSGRTFRIADSNTEGDIVRLPPALVQPESADDVVSTLADVAVGAPLNDTVELAGPEAFRLDDLARLFLRASDDRRQVTADVHARYFGAELTDGSLTPGDDARIASIRFEDWLGQSVNKPQPERSFS